MSNGNFELRFVERKTGLKDGMPVFSRTLQYREWVEEQGGGYWEEWGDVPCVKDEDA